MSQELNNQEEQQEINNIEELRKWFRKCPALSDQNRFRVNYLSESPTEYALYAVPSTIKFHENVLGEVVPDDRQVINYIFASKESYGADVQQNLAAMGFYEEIVSWIIKQNFRGDFPVMDGGIVKSIMPTLTAFISEAGPDSAKYQIQIKVTYKYIQKEEN